VSETHILNEMGTCEHIGIEAYSASLAESETIFPGSSGSFWQAFEMNSLTRRPYFVLDVPSDDQIRRALWSARSPVATYVRPPDDSHPQNAWLYVCQNRQYCLEDLGARARRDARRALRELRFEFADPRTLVEHGLHCFCDTRARVGLSDGTLEVFKSTYGRFGGNPADALLVAWKGDSLAAYMALTVVDDWLDIWPYATNEHLRACPVNGLIHVALDHFLVKQNYRLINYGLSSIQEVSSAMGLHQFKMKVGFECLPVHRAFVFHPLLKPFVNRAALWGLRACKRLRPGSPALRKAAGLLATHLGSKSMPGDVKAAKNED